MWFLFIINLACCIVNNWSVSGYYNIFGIDSTAIRSFALLDLISGSCVWVQLVMMCNLFDHTYRLPSPHMMNPAKLKIDIPL